MRSKYLRALYWSATLLFGVAQTVSAFQCLLEAPLMVEVITSLGYPIYFMKLLAVAKLVGIAAIATGRFPVLKEWAYAGFTFEVLAAILSSWSVGAVYLSAVPSAFLVLQLVSYWSWTRLEERDAGYAPTRRRVRVVIPASSTAMRGYY